ncbi:hypothetical protein EGR_10277 [Echinococcus granulosus]|uniref:Uncharacterized protein n=1 Tax=Echinococcus granulosus TaxID=6210 RepID=W6UMX6_ECHGR|nr:hypothetical protein EGR_10277 [Echinococcus granulosus]EUB54859.1 hypothetical protein EGR_10277 [Echinococcus granulosus]
MKQMSSWKFANHFISESVSQSRNGSSHDFSYINLFLLTLVLQLDIGLATPNIRFQEIYFDKQFQSVSNYFQLVSRLSNPSRSNVNFYPPLQTCLPLNLPFSLCLTKSLKKLVYFTGDSNYQQIQAKLLVFKSTYLQKMICCQERFKRNFMKSMTIKYDVNSKLNAVTGEGNSPRSSTTISIAIANSAATTVAKAAGTPDGPTSIFLPSYIMYQAQKVKNKRISNVATRLIFRSEKQPSEYRLGKERKLRREGQNANKRQKIAGIPSRVKMKSVGSTSVNIGRRDIIARKPKFAFVRHFQAGKTCAGKCASDAKKMLRKYEEVGSFTEQQICGQSLGGERGDSLNFVVKSDTSL